MSTRTEETIEFLRNCQNCHLPSGGGGEIKGSGDGEGNQRGKKEKKRKFGENITFDSTKS